MELVIEQGCSLTDEDLRCRVAEIVRLLGDMHKAAGGKGVRLAAPVRYTRVDG